MERTARFPLKPLIVRVRDVLDHSMLTIRYPKPGAVAWILRSVECLEWVSIRYDQ